jgi:toxin ParE1/3/4
MPSSRRLRFTPDADADLESLLQYTAEIWGESQMHAYEEDLFRVLDEIALFPGIGTHRNELRPGLFSHPIKHHIVFYEASNDELIVYRIIHSRRDIDAEVWD